MLGNKVVRGGSARRRREFTRDANRKLRGLETGPGEIKLGKICVAETSMPVWEVTSLRS